LWYSIKKHGKEVHSKEVLEHLPTREALKLRERQIVNEEMIADPLCMNLKRGGDGNSSEDARRIWQNPGTRSKIVAKMKKSWDDTNRRQAASARAIANWKDPNYAAAVLKSRGDWHPSVEHLASISKKNRAHHANRMQDEKNAISQKISIACKAKCQDPVHQETVSTALKKPWQDAAYREKMRRRLQGKIWVVNQEECKAIMPEQLALYLSQGYVRGRKWKF
jgi:hypothetical protein